MNNSSRYFTARVVCDSLGHEVIPSNAISVGTLDPVAECEARNRALDERAHWERRIRQAMRQGRGHQPTVSGCSVAGPDRRELIGG
jgi:hypothetical protein